MSGKKTLALAIGLPILVTLAALPFSLSMAAAPQDEGAIVVYADRILHGAVAYRDFQTFYGPSTPWFVGAAFLLGGESLVVERLVSMFWHVLVAMAIVALAWPWGARRAILSGLIASLILAPLGGWDQPWFAALALGVASMALMASAPANPRANRLSAACAGLLAALALSFRPDLGPALALAAIPLLAGRRRLVAYLAGAIVGLVPMVVEAAVATPSAMFQNLFVDAVLRAGPARRLPIPPSDPLRALALVAGLGVVALLVGAAVRLVIRNRRAPLTRSLASAALLSIGCLPQVLQRADLDHLAEGICVAAALTPITVPIVLGGLRLPWRRVGARAFAAACLVIGTVGVAAVDVYLHTDAGISVSNGGRSFILSRSTDPGKLFAAYPSATAAVVADVDRLAFPGARLFVGPADLRRTNYNSTFLYFLLPQLTPATYYLEMEPLNANRADSGLAEQIAAADVLVLDSQWDHWSEANPSSLNGSNGPNLTVMRDFCLQGTHAVYSVFTRCAK